MGEGIPTSSEIQCSSSSKSSLDPSQVKTPSKRIHFGLLIVLLATCSNLYLHSTAFLNNFSSKDLTGRTTKADTYYLSQDPFYISLFNNVSIRSTELNFNHILHKIEDGNFSLLKTISLYNHTSHYSAGFSTEVNLFAAGYSIIGRKSTAPWYNKFCLDRNISDGYSWCFNTLNFSAYSGCGEAVTPITGQAFEFGGGCCSKEWTPLAHVNISTGGALSQEKRYRSILVLNQHHGSSYFHVMYEVLPRFFYSIPLIDANRKLMIGVSSSPTMSQMLRLFNVNESRILYLRNKRRDRWLGANLLIYPPPADKLFGNDSAKNVHVVKTSALLRHRATQKENFITDSNTENRSTLILIERAKRRSQETGNCREERCLKNFEDLKNGIVKSLPQLNVEVYGPNVNLSRSIYLFSKAAVVVAVHGAGLQNQMFCKPGTTIIEIGDGPNIYFS